MTYARPAAAGMSSEPGGAGRARARQASAHLDPALGLRCRRRRGPENDDESRAGSAQGGPGEEGGSDCGGRRRQQPCSATRAPTARSWRPSGRPSGSDTPVGRAERPEGLPNRRIHSSALCRPLRRPVWPPQMRASQGAEVRIPGGLANPMLRTRHLRRASGHLRHYTPTQRARSPAQTGPPSIFTKWLRSIPSKMVAGKCTESLLSMSSLQLRRQRRVDAF